MEVQQHVQDVQEERFLWITWDTPDGEPRGCRVPFRKVFTKNMSPFEVLAKGPSFKVVQNYAKKPTTKLLLYKPTTEELAEAVQAFMKVEGGILKTWWIDDAG